MLRTVLAAITILHLGPGIAFAMLAFGCDGDSLVLGNMCGHNSVLSFVAITALSWLILGAIYAVVRLRSQPY